MRQYDFWFHFLTLLTSGSIGMMEILQRAVRVWEEVAKAKKEKMK